VPAVRPFSALRYDVGVAGPLDRLVAPPYDVLDESAQREYLARWICNELTNALNAKAHQDTEVDYWWQLYEQARTRRQQAADRIGGDPPQRLECGGHRWPLCPDYVTRLGQLSGS